MPHGPDLPGTEGRPWVLLWERSQANQEATGTPPPPSIGLEKTRSHPSFHLVFLDMQKCRPPDAVLSRALSLDAEAEARPVTLEPGPGPAGDRTQALGLGASLVFAPSSRLILLIPFFFIF